MVGPINVRKQNDHLYVCMHHRTNPDYGMTNVSGLSRKSETYFE